MLYFAIFSWEITTSQVFEASKEVNLMQVILSSDGVILKEIYESIPPLLAHPCKNSWPWKPYEYSQLS